MSRLFAASTVSWQEGVVTGDCVGDGGSVVPVGLGTLGQNSGVPQPTGVMSPSFSML